MQRLVLLPGRKSENIPCELFCENHRGILCPGKDRSITVKLRTSHEARCLVVLAGQVVERQIEQRATRIAAAAARGSELIGPDDIRAGTAEVLRDIWSSLPSIIEQELDGFEARNRSAA